MVKPFSMLDVPLGVFMDWFFRKIRKEEKTKLSTMQQASIYADCVMGNHLTCNA
jgi:hypothetical protein